MRRRFALCFLLFLLPAFALAQPMTEKDIALLLRMGVPEAEILQQLQKRRFSAPVDVEMEADLRAGGASANLLAVLKSGKLVVSEKERTLAARNNQEQLTAGAARDREEGAIAETRRKQAAWLAEKASTRDRMVRLLEGRLVRLQGSELRPFSSDELRETRIFAFYYAGGWCPACRKLTPQLIEWYRRAKAEHPGFELIWVTNDRSEITMTEYLRKTQMPWPAVRFDKADQAVRQFAGDGIPWLVAVSDSGKPLTTNGVTRQYLDPAKVIEGIDFLLAQLR